MPDEGNNPYQPLSAPYEQPSPGDGQPFYGTPQSPQPLYQQAYGNTQPNSNGVLLIVLSVVGFFVFGIFSAIPLIFSIMAYSAYSAGDMATGNEQAKIAKISLIVLLALTILVVLLVAVFFGAVFLIASAN